MPRFSQKKKKKKIKQKIKKKKNKKQKKRKKEEGGRKNVDQLTYCLLLKFQLHILIIFLFHSFMIIAKFSISLCNTLFNIDAIEKKKVFDHANA